MILLYSGSPDDNHPQPEPSKSLGGFISSSRLPNGKINNLFSPITRALVRTNATQTRLIVLKNTQDVPVSNIRIFTNDGTYSSMLISAILPGLDKDNKPKFEEIVDEESIPYQSELSSHVEEQNAITIQQLEPGQHVGIWILRQLDQSKFNKLDKGDTNITDEELVEILVSEETSGIDEAKLTIIWD